MTTTHEDLHQRVAPGRQAISLVLAVAVTAPALVVRATGAHLSDPVRAILFGVAIIGSAFILSWAAEAAQLDISAGLAIAVLAFIAVLPEYAVDLVFARKGGEAFRMYGHSCRPPGSTEASACSLALANMTGSNRLLIGVGWAL